MVTVNSNEILVPKVDPLYIKFGQFDVIKKILDKNVFYPIYIQGLSGNGKTYMVEQACAQAGRKLIRINLTTETDEDDLLGGFRLVDGATKWFDGPVVQAMKFGAVLLLDEVDCASTKIMAIQGIMEGRGVYLKKINQFVSAAPGFNVIATANTKGQGDETGKFVGAGPMNEAFLERFPITIEQDYPATGTEVDILEKVFDDLKVDVSSYGDFPKKLIDWANQTRQAFKETGDGHVITTRRLVHICRAYSFFSDRRSSIELCIARFDSASRDALMSMYRLVDPLINNVGDDVQDVSTDEEDIILKFQG